jgi:Holliday junction resolvasome RuvABC endonuclease subunit
MIPVNSILCIDPGFKNTGVAVIDAGAHSVVLVDVIGDEDLDYVPELSKSANNFALSGHIWDRLDQYVSKYKVSVLCMESMSYNPKNATVNAKISLIVGALSAVASKHGLTVYEASPQYLKNLIYGNQKLSKKESKEEIKKHVLEKYGDSLLKCLEDSAIPKSRHCHIYDALSASYLLEDNNSQRYTFDEGWIRDVRGKETKRSSHTKV